MTMIQVIALLLVCSVRSPVFRHSFPYALKHFVGVNIRLIAYVIEKWSIFTHRSHDNAISHFLPFRGPRKTNLIKRILSETFWGRLDVLLFDTPPGTSDEHLTIVKLLRGMAKLEGALVVTTTQEVALGVVRRETTFCKQMNLSILGMVQNMAGFLCPCCGVITGQSGDRGGKMGALQYSTMNLFLFRTETNGGKCPWQG